MFFNLTMSKIKACKKQGNSRILEFPNAKIIQSSWIMTQDYPAG
ncbi:hypothetical protein [Campylobacter sp.]|nr:hypothetical protein [Campylobacter sp.]